MTTEEFIESLNRRPTVHEFIESLELRYFRPAELLVATERALNEPPPRKLWHNIALPAIVLDRLRAELGKPIIVTSCYRVPAYNRKVGGSPGSQHQAFAAIDFKVRGVSPADVVEVLKRWRSEVNLFRIPVRIERVPFRDPVVTFDELETWDRRGSSACMMRWLGGIGRYSTFTHLDARGKSATWTGR